MQKDACQEQAFFVRGITALLHLLSSKDYQFRRKNKQVTEDLLTHIEFTRTVLLTNLQAVCLKRYIKKTKTCFGERFKWT